jgi:hypothetical protein
LIVVVCFFITFLFSILKLYFKKWMRNEEWGIKNE